MRQIPRLNRIRYRPSKKPIATHRMCPSKESHADSPAKANKIVEFWKGLISPHQLRISLVFQGFFSDSLLLWLVEGTLCFRTDLDLELGVKMPVLQGIGAG